MRYGVSVSPKNFSGYVRPVVTLTLTAALIGGFFLRIIPSDAFIPMVGMVIGFWFQSRTPQKG